MYVAAIKISLPHKARTQRTRPEDLRRRVLLERSAELPSTPVHAEEPTGTRINRDLGSCRARRSLPWRRRETRPHGCDAFSGTQMWHPKPAQPLTRRIIPQERELLHRRSNKNCDCSSLITFYGSSGDRHRVTKMKLWARMKNT
jgi:hypothetical protein